MKGDMLLAGAHENGPIGARRQLFDVMRNPRREPLRGLAAAALFDLGNRSEALDASNVAAKTAKLPELAWASVIRAGASGVERGPLVKEPRFRWIELGWIE